MAQSNMSSLAPSIVNRIGHGPGNQQPFDAQNPFNPKRRYAILFNEGPGYLLVDCLRSGAYSDTMLVQSLADGQIYARKLHDVQLHKEGARFQCDDLQNLVSHRNIPRLMSSRDYNKTLYHPNGGQPIKFITPVTTWQYCNGDRMFDLMSRWMWEENEDKRLPEAVIWNFMAKSIRFFLDTSATGVCHNDVHGGNIMFNWPEGSSLPELMFLDFGLANRYPTVSDLRYRQPFTGDFDRNGFPISNVLSTQERYGIRDWYRSFGHDMEHIIGFIQTMILSGQNDRYFSANRGVHNEDELFAQAASQQRPINGYPETMIMVVRAWSDMIVSLENQPIHLRAQLERLAHTVKRAGRSAIEQFQSNPQAASDALAWMKPPAIDPRPVIWKDPSPLLEPDRPATGDDIRVNRDDENRDVGRGDNFFEIYRYGDWTLFDPAVNVKHPRMSDTLILRRSQFRVVELAYDLATDKYILGRTVNSMLDVPSLSPDRPQPPTQGWHNFQPNLPASPDTDTTAFANTASRQPLRVRIPSGLRLPQVDGSSTLTPVYNISPDARREDFINEQTLNQPVQRDWSPVSPSDFRRPEVLPERVDEDTSAGRRYRAWRAYMRTLGQ